MRKRVEGTHRYAARLLFEFRVVAAGKSNRRRRCEHQIRLIRAASARSALTQAKRRGKQAQHRYRNVRGKPVHFEFVGVTELLRLGVECDPDEVWWEMNTLLLPSERRDRYIPSDKRLLSSAGS